MAEAKKTILTQAGYDKLVAELEYLKVTARKEIAEKIKEAREQGDLSENAEYDAAKDEQRDIEARIEEIEKLVKHVEIIADDGNTDAVTVGSKVTLYDYEFEEEIEVTIVGSTEADSLNDKISNDSPLGKALLGQGAGVDVVVETEAGETKFKIVSFERSNAI